MLSTWKQEHGDKYRKVELRAGQLLELFPFSVGPSRYSKYQEKESEIMEIKIIIFGQSAL